MKTVTLSTTKKKISLMLVALMLMGFTYGSTYTATSSGNFSSKTTWAGGVVPPTTDILDQITIQSGVNVNLDNNLTLNGALAQLDVAGTLSTTDSSSLIMNIGTLTGAGTVMLSTVTINATAVFSFTGSLTADTLNAATGFQSSATIMVIQTLNLTTGVLSLISGGSLVLGNNGTIVISGGSLLVNTGGSVILSGNYNVTYTGSSSVVAGLELSGSGLNNITINVNSGNSVTLTSNLTITGTLSLTSGTLILAGNNLTIHGNIADSGTGTISSDSSSDIIIATMSSSGSLKFAANANTVGNFTVNVGNNGSANIGSDMNINGTLLFSGGTLNIGGNALVIGASGSIIGTGNSTYIITDTIGYLEIYLTAGGNNTVNFPVGTSAYFAPATITLNAGSASGQVQVGVAGHVMAQGTTGTDLAATQPLVDATWNVHSDITGNVNLNLQVMWAAAMEVNGFNNNAAYIAHYTNGSWDTSALAAATVESNGMFSLQRNGLTSLSPFAVFNQNTQTAVAQIKNDPVRFDVLPNPASDNITIHNSTFAFEPMNMDIYNSVGQLVGSYKITTASFVFPVSDLINGNYFIRFYNDQMSSSKWFVKM